MSDWDLTKHLKIVLVLLIIEAVFGLAMSAMLGVLMMAFSCDAPGTNESYCMAVGAGFFLLSSLVTVGFPALCAFLLYKSLWWGRTLTIVYSILLCLSFPVGTIVGVYKLLVMLKLQREDKYFVV
ncbi:hypothetical protein [Kaarinaea lacus]